MRTSITIAAIAAIALGVGALCADTRSNASQSTPACHHQQVSTCPMMQASASHCAAMAAVEQPMPCHTGASAPAPARPACAMMDSATNAAPASCHHMANAAGDAGHAAHHH